MEIRQPTPDDLAHLGQIEAAADQLYVDRFGALGWEPPRTGHERALAPGFLLVAGERRGATYGFVQVLELNGTAHLEQLSVHPGHQRCGVGRALVEAAKRAAAERGYAKLSLMTYADVPWNAPFYVTCGFEVREPVTSLQRHLARIERHLGLDRHGRRVLMVASITLEGVTGE